MTIFTRVNNSIIMKNFFIILIMLCSHTVTSQTAILSGKIIDFDDKSPLIGVNISVNSSYGTASDINGEYTIELNPGKNSIDFQYIIDFKRFSILLGKSSTIIVIRSFLSALTRSSWTSP